uniref:P-loop NTPase n=1 Tax=Phenylobacterium glaciei TaxID=2803784 RepID=A0A974P5X5_9CAUL|nr:P-loop NTPase [Phenylobacterium glaciei]
MKVMSIGFLVDEAAPMIWRGPMASSAVRQMANDVAWGSEAEPSISSSSTCRPAPATSS